MKIMSFTKILPKPAWLNKKIDLNSCRKIKGLLRDFHLHSVCEESLCPNISECFSCGVATFMILGDICTRGCKFCNINKGRPNLTDSSEPKNIRQAVDKLGLKYVVITSPTRDDLCDGGAQIFSDVVKELKSLDSRIKVELLIPDFLGDINCLEKIGNSGAEVIGHNLETVPSLYEKVRKAADYNRSLGVLKVVKQLKKGIFTKSGLILGLGEAENEVLQVLRDLRSINCDLLTLGQYLPPSLAHYPLKEYIDPKKFAFFKDFALKIGFKGVKSAPYVRSSYMAHTLLYELNPKNPLKDPF